MSRIEDIKENRRQLGQKKDEELRIDREHELKNRDDVYATEIVKTREKMNEK